MLLEKILNELQSQFSISLPPKDDSGSVSLPFDSNIAVHISEPKDDILLIKSTISKSWSDSEKDELLLKQILNISFARIHQEDEILTWDPDANQLILFSHISNPMLLDKPFPQRLESFLNNLAFFNKLCENDPKTPYSL